MKPEKPHIYHVPRLKGIPTGSAGVLKLGLGIFLLGLIGAAGQENVILRNGMPDLTFDSSDVTFLPLSPLLPIIEEEAAVQLFSTFESNKITAQPSMTSNPGLDSGLNETHENGSRTVEIPPPPPASVPRVELPSSHSHELIRVRQDALQVKLSQELFNINSSEGSNGSLMVTDHRLSLMRPNWELSESELRDGHSPRIEGPSQNLEMGVGSLQALEDQETGPRGGRNRVSKSKRPRRSVVHLYDMVVCATGCNPLAYKGYGCYCGFLGSGVTVDGIDRCCAKHDWCYDHAKCPPLLTYFVPYYWTCNDGRPNCVTDYRSWKGICGSHLCECDRQFAECLRKFPCPRSRAMCITSPWRYPPEPDTVFYYP